MSRYNSHMTEERLAKITADLDDSWPGVGWEEAIRELIAGIRRLRAEKDTE